MVHYGLNDPCFIVVSERKNRKRNKISFLFFDILFRKMLIINFFFFGFFCRCKMVHCPGNKTILNKLLKFLEELTEHPFTGTGKPEPLKHELSGMWSRRMNREHRLIYEVEDDTVFIHSAKDHY